MQGKLYVVGTPIGNLGDMTPRAVAVLQAVQFIAAEDTRVTQKILHHFGIATPAVSYHEHNLRERGEELCARMLAGEDCAIVTDAGMPCISDPGEDLVRLCVERGIEIIVVPGASAAVSALAISGLSTSRFSFEGFLSTMKKNRIAHLQSVAGDTHTLIFYEAPHKLSATLRDMLTYLGDRRISLCRELTKIHEEVIRTTLSEAVERYRDRNDSEGSKIRGEFVLIIEGAALPTPEEGMTLPQAVDMARALIEDGQRMADACKQAAKETGYKKSDIYKLLLAE